MDGEKRDALTIAADIGLRALGLRVHGTNVNGSWDPVVPADLHLAKLPPVAEDGTVMCWRCRGRVQFSNANIVNQAYVCGPCVVAEARANAATSAYANAENTKLTRSNVGLYLVLGVLVALAVIFWVAVLAK